MEDLGEFNRGVSSIKSAISSALLDNAIKNASVSSVKQGSARIPDSMTFQIVANGRSVTEIFTKNEIFDAATGVDQMAVASRIRGIAARIAAAAR
jgi:hypothetical protein